MLETIRQKINSSPIQVLIIVITLALFIITNTFLRNGPLSFLPILFAIGIVVEIFVFVGMELKTGADKHGWKHEALDTLIALIAAVAIWYGLSFVLNTSSPISGVVSCSMLPNLQRGDFVLVHGVIPNAYDLTMSQAELDSLTSSPAVLSSASNILMSNSTNLSIPGSIFPFCISYKKTDICQAFIKNPESFLETKGSFAYKYEKCKLSFSDGTFAYEPCLKSVIFRGKEYFTNFSNDVIIYQPNKGDLYSLVGDIVHRTMFRVNVDGKLYYLTRGDNNPILDIQIYDYSSGMANRPVPQEHSKGKVLFRVPYLGYLKLFISGYFQEDSQCKTQLEFSHV